MAISEVHYKLLRDNRDRWNLPRGGSILEIGEANWYGDMAPNLLLADLFEMWGGDKAEFWKIMDAMRVPPPFALVKMIYRVLFGATHTAAIDKDGPTAHKIDLNDNIWVHGDNLGAFHLVINHGTAEHVFNIANVFKVMHDSCAIGGVMIHESPFQGWVDHGFYTLQPTLFYDVAHANGYEIVAVVIEDLAGKRAWNITSREEIHRMAAEYSLPENPMLFVVLRKTKDAPFRVPMQGVYDNRLSAEAVNNWRTLR